MNRLLHSRFTSNVKLLFSLKNKIIIIIMILIIIIIVIIIIIIIIIIMFVANMLYVLNIAHLSSSVVTISVLK